jgi:hypothetical protein
LLAVEDWAEIRRLHPRRVWDQDDRPAVAGVAGHGAGGGAVVVTAAVCPPACRVAGGVAYPQAWTVIARQRHRWSDGVELIAAVTEEIAKLLPLPLVETGGHAVFEDAGPGVGFGAYLPARIGETGLEDAPVTWSRFELEQSSVGEVGDELVHGLGGDAGSPGQFGGRGAGSSRDQVQHRVLDRGEVEVDEGLA